MAINAYLSQKPDFEKLVREARENPRRPPNSGVQTEYDRKVKEAVREVFEERRREAEAGKQSVDMPVHPKEEEAPSGEHAVDNQMNFNMLTELLYRPD